MIAEDLTGDAFERERKQVEARRASSRERLFAGQSVFGCPAGPIVRELIDVFLGRADVWEFEARARGASRKAVRISLEAAKSHKEALERELRRGTTTPPPATGKFTVGLTTSSLTQGGKFKLKFRITTQPAKPRGTARIKVTGPGAVTPSQQTIQLGANGAGSAEATVSQPGTYNAIAMVTVGGVTKTATDKEKVTARPSKPGAETVTLTPFIEWTAVERADGKGCPAGRVTLPPKTVTLGPPTIKNNVITPGDKAELTWTKRVCIADRVRAGLNGRYLSGPQQAPRDFLGAGIFFNWTLQPAGAGDECLRNKNENPAAGCPYNSRSALLAADISPHPERAGQESVVALR